MNDLERYSRAILLPEIGRAGQERLLSSAVAVIGCGALGTVIASSLVRAGVGRVKIADRDYIELNNLQRQVLFDEDDIAKGRPKAIAAAEKLRRVNSQIQVEPLVVDVNPGNVEAIIGDADLVLDGTDNFETRFLINDACVKLGIPWVYGAVIGVSGMTMTIVPHKTPCFRCFLSEVPAPGSVPTCDTVGVLGPAASIVASLQVIQGLKLLLGQEHEAQGELVYVEAWALSTERMQVGKGSTPCPACDLGQFDFLEAAEGSHAIALCGRDAVQIHQLGKKAVSFPELATRLQSAGEVSYNQYMLQLKVDSYELTVFPDGRAIVQGTADEGLARAIYARYVGQ